MAMDLLWYWDDEEEPFKYEVDFGNGQRRRQDPKADSQPSRA